MRRIRWLVTIIFLVGILCTVIPNPILGMTGTGSEEDPFVIYDVTDLQNMANNLSAYYVLANDIDASSTVTWNGGAGFDPIGSTGTPFMGHFNGNFYTIDGLFINRPTESEIGLFGQASIASIGNVTLTGVNFTGDDAVGGLVGYLWGYCYVSRCIVYGEIHCGTTDPAYFGGLVGISDGFYDSWVTNITRCEVHVDVDAGTGISGGNYAGGFIGECYKGTTITECCAYGDAYQHIWVGGFAGVILGSAIVSDCYSMGDVYVTDNGGIGSGQNGGGFVGANTGQIFNSYSIGAIYCLDASGCASTLGGFCGQNTWACTACFWDTQTSGWGTSACGTGKNTTEMTTTSTFTGAGWDFTDTWAREDGINWSYPYLLWQGAREWPADFTQQLTYMSNVMISGVILLDHNATKDGDITWGTFNTSVLIEIGEIEPYDPPEQDPDPGAIVPNPPMPEGWYPLCNGLEYLPFYDAFNDAALGMGMPDSCPLYMAVMMALAVAAGLGTMIFTGSALASAIVTGSFMMVCVTTTVVGWWMIFIFVAIAAGTLYLGRTA